MKLQALLSELENQKPLKWDRKLSAGQMKMALAENSPVFVLPNEELFFITKPCHVQIADKLEIPLKYFRIVSVMSEIVRLAK
jgi:hypothetical protein